jgi:hypothetical protein
MGAGMLSEIQLTRKQFITISDLRDGKLAIAYRDGSQICITTTGSSMIYRWENEKWTPYKPAPKLARFD